MRRFAYFAFQTVLVVALACVVRVLRRETAQTWQRNQTYEDTYYLPPTKWLRVASLGYHNAFADLIWTRALVYFGEELVRRGQVRYLYEHADAMIALDPDFRAVYRWVGIAALYRATKPTAADGYKAVEYLEKAVKRFPDDGELAWDLGATLRFELTPLVTDPKEKRLVMERAVEPLAQAARLGAGPAWLAINSAGLLQKLGRTEQAIRHIEELYPTVSDPQTKELLAQQLAQLRSQSYAEAFSAANRALEDDRVKNYPYLSPSMFLLVGARSEHGHMALRKRRFTADDVVPIE